MLGIDQPIISPDDNLDEYKNHVALRGTTPLAGHFGKFVILQEPLENDVVGRAIVAGAPSAALREQQHTRKKIKHPVLS